MVLLFAALTTGLQAFAEPEPPPPVKGFLCFDGGSRCERTTGTSVVVASTEVSRRFVWTSEDSAQVVVGEIPAGASSVDLPLDPPDGNEPEGSRRVRFSLRGETSRGWPSAVAYELTTRGKEWSWQIPAGSPREGTTLHLPKGMYRLKIAAPGHRTDTRNISAEKDLALGLIALKPLPVIHGRVVSMHQEKKRPVQGAQIVLGEGKVAGTTTEDGSFRIELIEPLPKEALVMSPAHATQVVLLEDLQAENDVGEIILASGVTLTLAVERPPELRSRSVAVKVLRRNEKRWEHSVLAKGSFAAGVDSTKFTNLPRGEYLVVLEGEAPTHRLVVPVTVGDDDATKHIELRPFRLNGSVKFGDEPVKGARLEITPFVDSQAWRAPLETGDDGTFSTDLWQPGRLTAFVRLGNGREGLMRAESPEIGSDPSEWAISFRNRLIHGRVFSKETGQPVTGAALGLQTTTADSRGYTTVRISPAGEYRIVAWQDGTYDLTLKAPDYPPQTRSVELAATDGSRQIDFELEQGSPVTIEVFSAAGHPIPGAQVLEGMARDGHNPRSLYSTDGAGKLSLRVLKGDTRVLYVLPREGSFAIARVTGDGSADERRVRVEVPPAAGALRLMLQDDQGLAAKGVVVMRFNGEWMPYPVTTRLRRYYADGMVQFLDVPAGTYEVWAAAVSPGRLPAIAGPPAHPPVRVGVNGGMAEATVHVVSLP